MTGHLFAFEHASGVLTLTGGAVRAVRDRDTVRGAKAAKTVALHGTGEAFTNRRAGNINVLPGDKVFGGYLCANFHQCIRGDPEFREAFFGFDLGTSKVPTHCF